MLKVRSRWGVWHLWGLLGIPMIVYGLGILFPWSSEEPVPWYAWPFALVTRILEWLYPTGNPSSAPALETRDKLWGWLFLIMGALLVAWLVWRTFRRGPALILDNRGITVASQLTGMRRLIPWEWIQQAYEDEHADMLDGYPALCLRMRRGTSRPRPPWGVHALDEGLWVISARNWDIGAAFVAQWIHKILQGQPTGVSPQPED